MKRIIERRCYFVEQRRQYFFPIFVQKKRVSMQKMFLTKNKKGGGDCFFQSFKTKRVLIRLRASASSDSGPIVFEFTICLSIAIQNPHLLLYIIFQIDILSPLFNPLSTTSFSRGCWLRSRLRLLIYNIVLCCFRPLSLPLSLFVSLSLSHFMDTTLTTPTISIIHQGKTASH